MGRTLKEIYNQASEWYKISSMFIKDHAGLLHI